MYNAKYYMLTLPCEGWAHLAHEARHVPLGAERLECPVRYGLAAGRAPGQHGRAVAAVAVGGSSWHDVDTCSRYLVDI